MRDVVFWMLAACVGVLMVSCAAAQARVLPGQRPLGASPVATRYTVTIDRPQTQKVRVTVELDDVRGGGGWGGGGEVTLMLPVWRPGRYEVLDPAGGVYDMAATDGAGNALEVRKADKSTWVVKTAGASRVRATYMVYCNSLGNRTRHVDDTHAFLSPSTVLVYDPKRRDRPVSVRLELPAKWYADSGMACEPGDENLLYAPDYDTLVDSPIEAGTHVRRDFEVDGVAHRIAVWNPYAVKIDVEKMEGDFAKIVREQGKVFGRLPYARFVFLIHVSPSAGGGTEHVNSFIAQTRPSAFESDDAYRRFLGLISHEMFHTWNVKQFRPAGLQPYDYQKENYTELLWVAEGTTSYYDDLTLARTGQMSVEKYLESVSGSIASVTVRPGSRVQSLEESSFDAWIKFNKPSADAHNTTVDFYTGGAMASLVLDAMVRVASKDAASLDTLLRRLSEDFPHGARGYGTADVLRILRDVSGEDFSGFFARHISGTEPLDFDAALAAYGLKLVREGNGSDASDESADGDKAAWIGADLRDTGGRCEVAAITPGSPADQSGFMTGDEFVALNGKRLTASTLPDRLDGLRVGDSVTIDYLRRDELRRATLTLARTPVSELRIEKMDDASDEQKRRFRSWIGQDW